MYTENTKKYSPISQTLEKQFSEIFNKMDDKSQQIMTF